MNRHSVLNAVLGQRVLILQHPTREDEALLVLGKVGVGSLNGGLEIGDGSVCGNGDGKLGVVRTLDVEGELFG